MDDCYREGLSWLAHSGIQAESGGVSRYYRGDTGEYKPISTEITAYAIQAYLSLPVPGEPGLLSHALRAGQFLCYDAGEPSGGLFRYEVPRTGFPPSDFVYFFDCGIIIRALIALWNATGDPIYLERAEACGGAMVSQMSRVDGAFFPVLDLSSGVPLSNSEKWSLEPGVYQLKVGLAFAELAELTSSGMFSRIADDLLRWCLRQHEMFLPGSPEGDQVSDRLHAYCYFLEGLVPFLERHFECAMILQSGLSRVQILLDEVRPIQERCDVIAQVLRLRLLSDYMGMTELDVSAATREAESLLEFQIHTQEPHTNGAFSFGRRNGQLLCHANPVTTLFALQALRMWKEHQGGELRMTWRELI